MELDIFIFRCIFLFRLFVACVSESFVFLVLCPVHESHSVCVLHHGLSCSPFVSHCIFNHENRQKHKMTCSVCVRVCLWVHACVLL